MAAAVCQFHAIVKRQLLLLLVPQHCCARVECLINQEKSHQSLSRTFTNAFLSAMVTSRKNKCIKCILKMRHDQQVTLLFHSSRVQCVLCYGRVYKKSYLLIKKCPVRNMFLSIIKWVFQIKFSKSEKNKRTMKNLGSNSRLFECDYTLVRQK